MNINIFKAATKYWASNTLPDPPTVTHLDLFNSTANNNLNVVDRYWMIGKTGPQNPALNYPVTDITFRFSTNNTAPQITERPPTMTPGLKPGLAQPWRFYGLSWLRITTSHTQNKVGQVLLVLF